MLMLFCDNLGPPNGMAPEVSSVLEIRSIKLFKTEAFTFSYVVREFGAPKLVLLTVKTIFKSQTSVKIEFDYEIYNEANELLTTGYSMLVFVDMKTGRPMTPPNYVSEKINSFLEV